MTVQPAPMIGTFQLTDLLEVLQGTMRGTDVELASVSTDTRTMRKDDLFVALKGENFDGDDYVGIAAEKGACAGLVGRYSNCNLPQLKVADTTRALGRLGNLNRQRSNARIIAITGSQGKTTVKEMAGRILTGFSDTLVTQGNLNNAIGVPLTLLRLEESNRFAVLELGANAPGEIAWTAALVQPDVAVITNAAGTHLEGFGSLRGVVAAKGEILDGLLAEGVAILNLDDPHVEVWRERAKGKRIATFSISNKKADYRATAIDQGIQGQSVFTLVTPTESGEVCLRLPGLHNVANAVAAAAAVMEAGAGFDSVVAGLTGMSPVKGRMSIMKGSGNSTLIDDSYNASPSSFHAAIQVLAAYPGTRILVAGDMRELGTDSDAAHRAVGKMARIAGIDAVLSIGESSRLTAEAFGSGGKHFATMQELIDGCRLLMNDTTTVLVKGSRSSGMDKIVDQLKINEAT
ncbi:MAG: UDP-N-acetylmuramoyl-tripeptide--D-alanyl-D-alanine ligase [Pseudohongiellaceae bacterium]